MEVLGYIYLKNMLIISFSSNLLPAFTTAINYQGETAASISSASTEIDLFKVDVLFSGTSDQPITNINV